MTLICRMECGSVQAVLSMYSENARHASCWTEPISGWGQVMPIIPSTMDMAFPLSSPLMSSDPYALASVDLIGLPPRYTPNKHFCQCQNKGGKRIGESPNPNHSRQCAHV